MFCCGDSGVCMCFPEMTWAPVTGFSTGWILPSPLDYEGVRHFIAPWRTYGGFIYFHLLLKGLTEAGFLNVKSER